MVEVRRPDAGEMVSCVKSNYRDESGGVVLVEIIRSC